ncbi:metal-dependent transcriptional regulator [Saxibacter everestensis]|uniref:Metal-dependent transcriptional regulator n=1 Tax=Saxibacter everestensis TaxID=2909229 RepID=A0ABY8QUH6_9MICO|nr:metal-dependent transcriptional regulator [Brevibacteriaceae bacterium ZFBP1038]
MNDLIDTTEMYLKTVLELEEEGVTPLRARIAERLGHSGPTVSQTVARMERDGLLIVSGDRHLEFTADGRGRAIEVMRKHRLAERLLADVVGLEWELVHDEACRWEHVMSEQVERKLVKLLASTDASPYGNPIPGLSGLGLEDVKMPEVQSLVSALPADGRESVTVAWIGEPIQVDPELLGQLAECGVVPDGELGAERSGSFITVAPEAAEDALELPIEVAAHIFVLRK